MQVRFIAPHRMPVRLVSLPLWRTVPATERILKRSGQEICANGHRCGWPWSSEVRDSFCASTHRPRIWRFFVGSGLEEGTLS